MYWFYNEENNTIDITCGWDCGTYIFIYQGRRVNITPFVRFMQKSLDMKVYTTMAIEIYNIIQIKL